MKPTLQPRRSRSEVRALLTDYAMFIDGVDSRLIAPVVADARFWEAPASVKWHHSYDGGLAEHTLEVLEACDVIAHLCHVPISLIDLRVAAFWHDYAKVWDYEKGPAASNDGERAWTCTDHSGDHGHLVRSYAEWMAHARTTDIGEARMLKIGSMLLSHHGQKAWGSPVEPRGPEAWALHLADMISVHVVCDRVG
jgi:3'-5' exoribonuclease